MSSTPPSSSQKLPRFLAQPRQPRISGDEDWIYSRSLRISPRKVHAIGHICLKWNWCEEGLAWVAGELLGCDKETTQIVFGEIPDNTLIEKIKKLLIKQKLPKEINEIVLNAIEVYDVCRINRNYLVHAVSIMDWDRGSLLHKKNKSNGNM